MSECIALHCHAPHPLLSRLGVSNHTTLYREGTCLVLPQTGPRTEAEGRHSRMIPHDRSRSGGSTYSQDMRSDLPGSYPLRVCACPEKTSSAIEGLGAQDEEERYLGGPVIIASLGGDAWQRLRRATMFFAHARNGPDHYSHGSAWFISSCPLQHSVRALTKDWWWICFFMGPCFVSTPMPSSLFISFSP